MGFPRSEGKITTGGLPLMTVRTTALGLAPPPYPWGSIRRRRRELLSLLPGTAVYIIALNASGVSSSGVRGLLAAIAWLATASVIIARGSGALCPRCHLEFFLKRYQSLVWPRWWTTKCQNCGIRIGEGGSD